MTRTLMTCCLLAMIVGTAACGGSSPASPSTPGGGGTTTPPPTVVQAAGTWTGIATQVSATGTECLAAFQSPGGQDRYTLTLTQSDATLTGTVAMANISQTCVVSGTASTTAAAVAASSCSPSGYQLTCSTGARDAFVVQRTLNGTVSGNTMTGTGSETWAIFARGTTTNSLGTVVVNTTFSFSK